jgi:hypothetical protein
MKANIITLATINHLTASLATVVIKFLYFYRRCPDFLDALIREAKAFQHADSSSRDALSFSSARTIKRPASSRSAATTQNCRHS